MRHHAWAGSGPGNSRVLGVSELNGLVDAGELDAWRNLPSPRVRNRRTTRTTRPERAPAPMPERIEAHDGSPLGRLTCEVEGNTAMLMRLRRSPGVDRSENRVNLWITDEITHGLANTVVRQIYLTPFARFSVRINSGGGEVDAAYRIIGAITAIQETQNRPVTGYATEAASAALVVFASCGKRIAHPNARFLHHSSSAGGCAPRTKLGRLECQQVDAMVMELFQRTGADCEALWMMLRAAGDRSLPFDAQVALATGIATQVEWYQPRAVSKKWTDAVAFYNRMASNEKLVT